MENRATLRLQPTWETTPGWANLAIIIIIISIIDIFAYSVYLQIGCRVIKILILPE